MEAKLQTNKVFELLMDSDKRITVMQGGSRCFTGETLVRTYDGYQSIRNIEPGQLVWCINNNEIPVIRKVVDKFIYKADHTRHNVITFVLSDNKKITCTYGHKLLQNDGYVTAVDIAFRMLDAGEWDKCPLPGEQPWSINGNAIQEQERRGWNEDYETSQRCQRIFEDNDINQWEIYDNKTAQISSRTFRKQSIGEAASKPYQQRKSRQSCRELGVGDISGEYRSHDEARSADFQQWREEWKKYPYFRYCKVDTNGIQTIRNNGKRLGGKVWSEQSNDKGHPARKKLEIGDVKEIIFHQTTETVYDIEVEEFHNYFVTTDNIISHNSGKTYNILIWFIVKLLQENGKTLTIVRQSLPSIKGTVLRDFIDILGRLGIYDENNHNKTDQIYEMNGNIIEFVSADQPQKIRGRARDYLFCNEANELSYDAWMQLIMRTEGKIVIDYNPSDVSSWIYDMVIPRDDADFYITTFRDNPFLPKELIMELERMKDADPNYWQVYGLGERGLSQDLIYTHYKTTENFPDDGEVVYGLDFGFNVPSAMVKVVFKEGIAFVKEMLYEAKLTTNDLIDRLKAMDLSKYDEIYCDAAEPKTIEELVRNGFNAKPANKDVTEGIRCVKGTPLTIHQDSVNLLKELKSYRWKTDRNGNKLDQPVKFNDHIADAMRYGIYSKLTIPSLTWGVI
jgi:phage terminase large subunit